MEAFVVDCFSRAIVGRHADTVKDTAMVATALSPPEASQ
jgi:putative transposase